MSKTLQAVRGMNDILPQQAESWEGVEALLREWLESYAYRPIRTPILEMTPLFTRAIGAVTDIVEKEMYSFTDSLNGEALTLRPEGTAACARAVLQHSLLYDGPKRLWYMGPMFRHERPQQGRYRQFHQLGVEAFGLAGPDIDAEQIIMADRLWQRLELSDVRLEINCLGQPEERAQHREQLIAYFQAHEAELDDNARQRLHSNPLRILDSKNPALRPLIEAAPVLTDFLGGDSRRHFDGVRRLLDEAAVPYRQNPYLVRGLDYYNLTVFEWISDQLGAQGTICAGGRYDGLLAQLGGKPAAACGFAIGIERIIALLGEQLDEYATMAPEVYLVHQGEASERMAFRAADALRETGFTVLMHMGGGSFKSQFKRADASGAMLAVVIGDDEVAENKVILKPLRRQEEQQRIALEQLVDTVIDWMYAGDDDE